jgi:hypothetical protein
MKKIIAERKTSAFYIKLFLKMHPDALKIEGYRMRKSPPSLEQAYEKKLLPSHPCETTVIDDTSAPAERRSQLITMVLPDGRAISGYKDAAWQKP